VIKHRALIINETRFFVLNMPLDLIFAETTQLEDPRQEWRAIQEAMLREYMQTAHDVLEVSTENN